jgi:glycosyltransferase involved in cell wall biosynthesis
MKALAIFSSTVRGGAEEYALKITSNAVKEGWDVHIAFPKTDKTASLIKDFREKGVKYHRLEIAEVEGYGLKQKAQHFLYLTQTFALLLKINPDVVQINLPWPNHCLGSILACGMLRIPTVVLFHLIPHKFSFGSRTLKAYAWARSRNQKWVSVSENNRQFLCESFRILPNDVIRIYNGVKRTSTQIESNKEEYTTLRDQVRQELGIPKIARLALTIGRLESQKGYSDLIPVVPHISKEFPDVRFVWVGEGKQRDELANRVREYSVEDKVLFLGHRSDVPRLLKAADLFVFPTHYEGLSLALAEAMGHGLPIITSNASSIPEIVEDKVHGLLFRKGDSSDLLEALRWALRHPNKMQEMAQRAHLRIQEFSEERMIQETLDLWQTLSHTPRLLRNSLERGAH